MPTATGFKTHNLITEDLIVEWLPKDNPEMATQLLKLGVRAFMHKLAGYTVSTSAMPQQMENRVNPALIAAREIEEIHNRTEYISPRLAQLLIDSTVNHHLGDQKQIAGSTDPQLRGVVEIAEEMGFKVTIENRSLLGRFVSKQVGDLAKPESRLVNGTMRQVKCYPDTEQVRKAISDFFS